MDLPDCPPGTEDYEETLTSHVVNSEGTKVRRESQSYVDSVKVKLQDGSVRNMFERKEQDPAGQWIYLCYPCGATCRGEATMQNHRGSKQHQARLESCKVWPLSIFNEHPYYQGGANKREPTVSTEKPYSVLDGIINEPCALQPVLDEHKSSPLVGLEYLVELEPEEEYHVPQYHCLLCNKQGHPRSIINHLISPGHHSRFVKLHYIAVHRALGPYRKYTFEKGTRAALQTLAVRVEQTHGRMKPLRTTHRHFQKHRHEIYKHIVDGPHLSEKMGPSFLEVVDEDLIHFLSKGGGKSEREPSPLVKAAPQPSAGKQSTPQLAALTKVARNGSTESLSSISLSSLEASPVMLKDHRQKREADHESSAQHHKRYRPNSPQAKGFDITEQLIFQKKLSILERIVQKLIVNSDKKLSYHEKNPEKHPLYPEEWKKFWNQRYKELQNKNEDPTKFDFKPEWIAFWMKRLKELHEEELQSQKNDACRRLNMPLDVVDAKGVIVARSWKDGMQPSHRPKWHHSPPCRSAMRRASPHLPHHYSPRQSSAYRSPPRHCSPRRCYSPVLKRPRFHRSPLRRRPTTHLAPEPYPDSHKPLYHADHNYRTLRESTLISDDKLKINENENGNLSPREDSDSLNLVESTSAHRSTRCSVPRRREASAAYAVPSTNGKLSPWGDSDSLTSVKRVSARRSAPSSVPQRLEAGEAYAVPSMGEVVTLGQEEVVSVLRRLSALEDYLGSIGPRVVDLLAQALKMEKNCPNSSEELLLDEAHCMLVDTAKEKLNGTVQARLVPDSVMGAVLDAISYSAALLHHAEILQRKHADEEKAHNVKEGVRIAGVGAVEKAAIAQQIAAALVAQGKTDVTTEELSALVDAVVGMASAKGSTAPNMHKMQDESSTKVEPTTTTWSQPSGSALQMLNAGYDETTRLKMQEKPRQDEKQNDEKDQDHMFLPKQLVNKSSMDGLSDSDLKTLLQNFKDLSSNEQHGLIGYLRKLESHEPARVERLRQFMNTQPSTTATVTAVDSDDDDYTVDEVFKSAALKVKENQMQLEMEVVQKSLQLAQPVGDVSKVLVSLLSSLPPSPVLRMPDASAASCIAHSDSSHPPLTRTSLLNSNADGYQSDALDLQDDAPSVCNYVQSDARFHRDEPDICNNFQENTKSLQHPSNRLDQNQSALMQRPLTFLQYINVGSVQEKNSFESSYNKQSLVSQGPDNRLDHCLEEYESQNSVSPGESAADTWDDRLQIHAHNGINATRRGRQRHRKRNRPRRKGNYSNYN